MYMRLRLAAFVFTKQMGALVSTPSGLPTTFSFMASGKNVFQLEHLTLVTDMMDTGLWSLESMMSPVQYSG